MDTHSCVLDAGSAGSAGTDSVPKSNPNAANGFVGISEPPAFFLAAASGEFGRLTTPTDTTTDYMAFRFTVDYTLCKANVHRW